ncbi:MAG: RHS repeat-associated core domain-containing protein [Patescibacteria group bacterium]|nr:RHS repeat-associated core domain-containing protein [Patescibacteria group bacterium]
MAAKEISLGYNDQGLLATVTRYTDGDLAVLAQYAYDSASRLTALTYSQGETILASYAWTYSDDGASLLSVQTTSPHAPLSPFAWLPSGGLMPGQDTGAIVDALWEGTGTPAGLITEITSLDGSVSYSYDSAGQLLGATYTTGRASEAYSYDAAGNRVTANGAAYLTGPNNQLLFDGVFSYSYDPEGNRTARFIDCNANGLLDAGDTGATTYAWDHRNRLTRVTDYDLYGDPATRAIDFLYDTENRWIGRDVDLDADGNIDTRTRFAYDGNQIVMQFDRAIAATDDPAEPLTLENLSHRYLWNPAAVDQLMADEHVTTPDTPGTILWPLADHLGTIRDLAAYDPATATTTVVNHRTFDAYGNLQSQTSTNPAHDTLFAFTGRPLDEATGLQNNLPRWYDPAVGRWMTEDPIGFEGKDGNLYAYVGNGPVNATDPSGLEVWVETTPSVGGWHRRITVHVRDENGDIVDTYSISYGRHHDLPNTQGIVYRDTDPTLRKAILMRYTTTPEQDAQILILMRSIEGRTGAYHPIYPNCRTFSETLYWDIIRALLMTGKPPEVTTFPLHPRPPGPLKPQVPPFPPLGSGSSSGGE